MSDQPTRIVPTDGGDYGGYGGGSGYGGYGDSSPTSTRPTRRPLMWNPATDLGLLLLRFGIGGVFFTHGVQSFFGWWGGTGLGGWTDVLRAEGFTDPGLLALPTAVAEMVAGALVVVGFGTPLAAAGLFAMMLNAVLLHTQLVPFFVDAPQGQLEIVLGLGAAALALTGAGRIAVESGRTWNRRPAPWGVLALVLGVVGGLVVYFALR